MWEAAGGVAAVIMIGAYNAMDNSPSGKVPSSPASSQAGVRPDPGPPPVSPVPAPKHANTPAGLRGVAGAAARRTNSYSGKQYPCARSY
jgi:hypothetical protein